MSWTIFKNNVIRRMAAYSFEDNSKLGEVLSKEYDSCMKRGYDIVNKNPIKKGNPSAFESAINSQQLSGLNSTSEDFYSNLYSLMGNAVKAYWAGAQLFEINPPLTPAPGAIKNLNILPNGNLVTNVGQFGTGVVFPTTDIDTFINGFIILAKVHLTTISGICNVLAQYPPPAPPAPGMVNWIGYTIPAGQSAEEFGLTEEDITAIMGDIKGAEEFLTTKPPKPEATTAQEFISFNRAKLVTKENVSVEQTEEPQIEESSDIGNRIVQYAKLDIGKKEDPLPPGKPENSGQYVLGLLKGVGINGPAYWCAAFVSSIYKKAGAASPNSAGCDEWRAWAKRKSLWTLTPSVGAAILYGSEADAHHIGIVESFDKASGIITTIEGNTSGGGFSRNGVGTFRKKTTLRKALGFVKPIEASSKTTKK